MTAVALDPRRRRALALMGIDVYRLRGAPSAEPARSGAGPHVEPRSDPSTAPRAADILFDAPARVRIVIDAAAGDPRTGPYATLLAGIVRALGIAPADVGYGRDDRAPAPALCFGVAPPAVAEAHGLAPLAAVRQSPTVKRALWQALRPLRRRLGRV
jgi:hypothetical protein